MSAIKLATRYAKSLLDLSIEQGKLEEIYADQKYITKVIDVSRDFALLLKSPLVHADKKFQIIEKILGNAVSDVTISFIRIVVRKRREFYLEDIAKAFINQYNEYKHITPVRLKTAVDIDLAKVDELLAKIKKEAGLEKIELAKEVDSSLIGGFVLQFGDKLYDASIARSIDLLKKELKENEYIKKY